MDASSPATLHTEAAGAATARHLDLAANTFQQYRGTVVRPDAASVTASFPDAALAARAAVEFQRRLLLFNLRLPEGERVGFRTGIHNDPRSAVELARKGDSGRVLVSRPVSDSVVLERGFTCNWLREDVFELMGAEAAVTESGETLAADTPPPAETAPVAMVAASLPARYEILSEIGRGGMGVVYKARDRETQEVVALKVLQADLTADSGLLQRFKNELRLARRITHKNVCRIHEFNRSGGLAYISMEYVDGQSLRDMLQRSGKLAPAAGASLAQQVCAGLHEAHAQGVVHRDLKPENIMVDRSGVVKLMDFGIARSLDGATTHTRGIIGTPAYMAPEQAEGRPVDHRTDIYSLGLILFEMFTGTQAFKGQTLVEVVLKQIRDTPPRPASLEPGLPAHLENAVLRCLEKDPARRFQSVQELDAALSGKLVSLPPPTSPAEPFPTQVPAPRLIARKRRVWIVLILLLGFFGLRQFTRERRTPTPRRQPPPVALEEAEPPPFPKEKKVGPPPKKEGDPKADAADALKQLEKLEETLPPVVSRGLGALGRFIPPEKLEEMLRQGDQELEAGNFNKAREVYVMVLTFDPKNERAKEGLKKVSAGMREQIRKQFPPAPKPPPKP